MRVLLMGEDTGQESGACRALEREGHEVVRCHPPDQAAFPCAALLPGFSCPLEDDAVRAAVVVGDGFSDELDVGAEEGSRCALRLQVPLVTVGYPLTSPLVPWATASVADARDLGVAVRLAVAAPMRAHDEAATAALHDVLSVHGRDTTATHVEVRRVDRGLRAEIHAGPDIDAHLGEVASVRVLAALRTVDPHASTIGVAVLHDDLAPA